LSSEEKLSNLKKQMGTVASVSTERNLQQKSLNSRRISEKFKNKFPSEERISYQQRMDASPQELHSIGTRNFTENVSLLNKRNKVNPMINKSNREQLSLSLNKSSEYKRKFQSNKGLRLATEHKSYFLNPTHMG